MHTHFPPLGLESGYKDELLLPSIPGTLIHLSLMQNKESSLAFFSLSFTEFFILESKAFSLPKLKM